jgi:hypothetical protein
LLLGGVMALFLAPLRPTDPQITALARA